MPSGTVKWFDVKKGYGYIQPDDSNKDVRVNLSDVAASGWAQLMEHQRVEYDLQPGYGTTIAVNLKMRFAKSPRGLGE